MPAIPFKVKAVYDYNSAEPDDLTFSIGQIITVTDDADEDWYTGEYPSTSGEKVEGIFPRNFVEKYEPAVPSRPARAPKRAPVPEPEPEPPAPQRAETAQEPAETLPQPEPEAPKATPQPTALLEEPAPPKAEPAQSRAAPTAEPRSPPTKAGPPPVAEKPSSNSFKDRIAAFNKPAAAPVAPFKPGGSAASGFIKKPFVAPPPSKNAYVPPPRELPPQKIYQREEEPTEQLPIAESSAPPPPPPTADPNEDEDQPKPTSLKDRIALLQKQQLEQAQRLNDASGKKEKPKKPPKKRVEPVEEAEAPSQEPDLERLNTNETVGKNPSDLPEDAESVRPSLERQQSAGKAPLQPSRELVSDTNDADDSGAGDTEDAQEMSTEEERPRSKGGVTSTLPEVTKPAAQKSEDREEEAEEEEEDTEEEEDPEIRRRRELRERMAKMSGGMGMMGMFGGPAGAAPPPRKSRQSQEHGGDTEQQAQEQAVRAPPVPIMALPGMSNQLPKRAAESEESESDDGQTERPTPREQVRQSDADDDYVSQPPPPPRRTDTMRSSASIERPPPPPPPQREGPISPTQGEGRAVPPPPPAAGRSVPPPPPVATSDIADGIGSATSPRSPRTRRSEEHPMSPSGAPPVPRSRPDSSRKESEIQSVSSPVSSPQSRAPPPPPPGQPPSRRSTAEVLSPQPIEDSDEEVTEYDGDYDTDIASSAKHKDALKSHQRDSSLDDDALTDEATKSPKSPPQRSIPPLPPMPAQQTAPPPPPPQAAPVPVSRKSMDAPRAPPPVPPPAAMPEHDEDDYDPYRYNSGSTGMPTPQLNDIYKNLSPREERDEGDLYGSARQPPSLPPPPPADRAPPPMPPMPPTERTAPPPPPMDRSAPPPPPSMDRSAPPPPMDRAAPPPPPPESPRAEMSRPTEPRRSGTLSRRSMEQTRAVGDGFIAQDIDLAHSSFWWTQANLPPPSLANRSDLLYEIEENVSSKRGGRTTVSKDVYVLYSDYSQTTINATFDKADPSQVALEQKHERPPPPFRHDQLEAASQQYGSSIASAATTAGNQSATVADGSAHGFIYELFNKSAPAALRPIGTRAFGAIIYSNMANTSVQSNDEIRPGDIVSFRNAKFSGHKGTMHQKYSMEAGKPDHAAVVAEWDGAKKKLRVWEQRSEGDRKEKKRAKVRDESYKLDDLKSGEVKVWRVVGREYVGWGKS